MKARLAQSVLVLILVSAPALQAAADRQVTTDELHSIGVDAYVYLYPLVTMDITRKQLTNVERAEGIDAPMNGFANVPAYPSADMKVVVRPNFDTLYSSAWLDLTREPVVVSVPDTDGRYYLLPMLDMWSDVFASPGWRTTGTRASEFLIATPSWQGSVPAGVQRIDAPTPYVWIIGRIKTDGPADYDAVHRIQAGLKIVPLSQRGRAPAPVLGKVDAGVDMKTPPKIQVDTMPAKEYFSYAAELLALHPPHATDQPMIARLRHIGIVPGKDFDWGKLDPAVQQALTAAPAEAQKLMSWKLATLARVANGWSMNTDTMGVYGNYYLKRAVVAQVGLGANLPEDAVYPMNLGDESGKPLDGTYKYTLRFDKANLPPVAAFWSVTMYDMEGYQVANELDRFAVSSWMPLTYNADGSLDLHIQHQSPGKALEGNWLPAPKGPFNLTMRLYAPKLEVLTGKWNPPVVTRVQEPAAFSAQ